MSDFFYAGGIFMWPLALLGLVALIIALKKAADVFGDGDEPASFHRPMINTVLQIGIFSFFFGILSQAIGLIEALQAIEMMGDVSPAMLAGGLKVSMIAPVFGLLIFLGCFAFWSVLKYRNEAQEAEA